jgi:hypothetical protein
MFKKEEEIDIEEFLNNLDVEEETVYENADAYVKPVALERDTDVQMVADELKKGNIVLLNIAGLSKRNTLKLRELISGIRSTVNEIDGDIARITTDRVILTPSKVKIIKRRE